MTIQGTGSVIQDTVSNSSTAYDWTVTFASEQSDVAKVPLGSVTFDVYGREWMYCRANGTTAAGKFAWIATDGTFDATPATTALVGTPGTDWKFLGAPNVAVTDNYYAWYFVGSGEFEGYIEASFTAADVVYTTDNAGIIGADNSSFQVEGVKVVDTSTTAGRYTIYAADRMTVGVVEAHD